MPKRFRIGTDDPQGHGLLGLVETLRDGGLRLRVEVWADVDPSAGDACLGTRLAHGMEAIGETLESAELNVDMAAGRACASVSGRVDGNRLRQLHARLVDLAELCEAGRLTGAAVVTAQPSTWRKPVWELSYWPKASLPVLNFLPELAVLI